MPSSWNRLNSEFKQHLEQCIQSLTHTQHNLGSNNNNNKKSRVIVHHVRTINDLFMLNGKGDEEKCHQPFKLCINTVEITFGLDAKIEAAN